MTTPTYLLAIDQGTTSTRAIVFDRKSQIIGIAQKEFTQYFPQAGWVQQDAEEIWQTVIEVMGKVLQNSKIKPEQIAAIGITNQRETTVVWDKKSGEPVYSAIVWQSRQSKSICDKLKEQGYSELIKDKTGLVIDSYFSASKIKWIFDNVRDSYQRALNNELLAGTIDTWLLWKLTGGQVFATDYSNASRTMLYNIYEKRWDPDLLKLFNIPESMLAEVKDSSTVYGYTTKETFFNQQVPIAGIAGDQQAALFGQTCWQAGQAKNTYGTGCFLLMNTKAQAIKSQHGLLTTLAWGLNGEVDYALEGSVFVAGSAVQWLRDGLQLIKNAADTQTLAASVQDNQEVVLVPAFVGLGAPYWNDEVAGAIFGLTRATTKAHLAKATLEAIALQTKDITDAMAQDANLRLTYLGVDGGACANDYLLQFQSDILGVPVERKTVRETTALGAAYFAGLAIGFFRDLAEIKDAIDVERVFKPQMDAKLAQRKYENWQMAVQATCQFKIKH